jgi:hypothetical protein
MLADRGDGASVPAGGVVSIPDPQRTICPNCGRVEPVGEDFCECGEYLGWDDPEAPSDDAAPAEEAPAAPTPKRAPDEAPPDDRPDVASLDLRLPDREHRPGAAVRLEVAPGGSARLHALIRNEGRLVDDWAVTVGGLPEDWWTVRPDVVNLLPMSDRGGSEEEVEIELHPPRDPKAEARAWTLDVVATPVNTGAAVVRAPLTLTIGSFSAHGLELRPRRSSGRRSGRHEVTVHNRGNARLDVRLEAVDDEGVGRFAFAPPLLDLRPGEQRVSRLEVRPPSPILVGRGRELPLKVTGHAGSGEAGSADATYRQRPWLPWWAIPVLAAAIALLVVL